MKLPWGGRRGLVLCLVLLCAALGYTAVAIMVGVETTVQERHIGETPGDNLRFLRLYVEVLAVDAVNESAKLRLTLSPGPALQGRRVGAPAQEVTLQLVDGDRSQDLTFRAEELMAPAQVDVDLNDGPVTAYPLDRYRVRLRAQARASGRETIPLATTVWDGLPGWTVLVARHSAETADEIGFDLHLKRSAAVRLLVLALYGEMALIGLAALTIGSIVFLGIKPPESTLTGALTGMIFALPALRYALPGTPPLGVAADLLVFFWAELAVALTLILFVFTWAGTRPNR